MISIHPAGKAARSALPSVGCHSRSTSTPTPIASSDDLPPFDVVAGVPTCCASGLLQRAEGPDWLAACSSTRPGGCRLCVFGFLLHSFDQVARMQKAALSQAPEERENRPFPWSQAPMVQARGRVSVHGRTCKHRNSLLHWMCRQPNNV